MQAYLFDANHVTALYNRDERLAARVNSEPQDRNYLISKITRGELEAGHRMGNPNSLEIEKFWDFVDFRFYSPEPLENEVKNISSHYGEILGRLHKKEPKKDKQKTELWLREIGVQVNDVWFVAEGWGHRLVCVTNDGMDKIKGVLEPEIESKELRFEDWLS